jgi:hypothetical protein
MGSTVGIRHHASRSDSWTGNRDRFLICTNGDFRPARIQQAKSTDTIAGQTACLKSLWPLKLAGRNRAWEARELFDLADDVERELATPDEGGPSTPSPRRRDWPSRPNRLSLGVNGTESSPLWEG